MPWAGVPFPTRWMHNAGDFVKEQNNHKLCLWSLLASWTMTLYGGSFINNNKPALIGDIHPSPSLRNSNLKELGIIKSDFG